MNEAFRNHAFGRHFNLTLRENHVDLLAKLCQGDAVASIGFARSGADGLLRRGLIESRWCEKANAQRWYPTKAGLLVYGLMVEAGEHVPLNELRRATLEAENEAHRLEWEERLASATSMIKLKDRFRKPGVEQEERADG